MIISTITTLSLFFTFEMCAIFHIDGLSRFIIDWSKALHLVIWKSIHGNVLTLYVGVSWLVHLVFTWGLLLRHKFLLTAILILSPARL